MPTSENEQQQRCAWTDLVEALRKKAGTLQTPADARNGLGEALRRPTMDETEVAQATLDVRQAALDLAALMARRRGADDAARAMNTAFDKYLTWQKRCVMERIGEEDGTLLYLVELGADVVATAALGP
ncbi:hypothetical protein PHYSODRAFT_302467 [Phytophthora sojae]|uniref:Uncharacterized protein n=1 Tax=Phytophthora sojae (strain P6497) TaxID=1094619 RepID=G4ZP40_PHYSP|nr:hypothetical protein PHYSODRAFT_302467 [Phytophthora sojae]EGZ16117.1 hypothetical protein PHYSODRAFT_302467 [Phytophthora sojae]|eukprot:XP_009529866.1 hypothetical protein PHYSODRAFT_302467 [Phytophthora sojae]